jgi:excinuclease ABC subunit C
VLRFQAEFVPEHDAEFFAAIPAKPAVFLLRGEAGTEPYVSKTANLRRRLMRLLSAEGETTRRLNLRNRVRTLEYSPTGSDFESQLVLYKALRETFPKNYVDRLRLRFAPLVHLHLENRYPRASVTVKLGKNASEYYGPFVSRVSAEKFANDALDFFKMRRCVEELNPDPKFPGCVYSEMKMCLAPCFKGCTDQEYSAEVARVQEFFDTGGQSLRRELEQAREKASADLEFETAAALHAKIEKLKPVLGQVPEIVTRIDRMKGLMIQPAAEPDSVMLFQIDAGRISEPIPFLVNQPADSGKMHSMEARLQEALAAPVLGKTTVLDSMEQLAILKRWYYRTSKTGEAFFADQSGELPWRRIVRGLSRVFRGEKAAPDLSESAKDYWIFRHKEAGLQ